MRLLKYPTPGPVSAFVAFDRAVKGGARGVERACRGELARHGYFVFVSRRNRVRKPPRPSASGNRRRSLEVQSGSGFTGRAGSVNSAVSQQIRPAAGNGGPYPHARFGSATGWKPPRSLEDTLRYQE